MPTAHVHILCGGTAFPQSLAIFRGGKGLSYTRAGTPLCVAVIHGRLYKQLLVKAAARAKVVPQGSFEWPVDIWLNAGMDTNLR